MSINHQHLCIKTDILTTLTYFDIFSYPLTQTEIFFFLHHHYLQEEYITALMQLVRDKQIHQHDEFLTLSDNYELVIRRRKGNQAAKKLLDKAERIAGFLSSFPFVRGVAISGSLSKNYADDHSDIDFFIITAENRLWIARTLMHLFKKIAILSQKGHLFCMNYYVDEQGLQIKEKNIYTATELATLIPLRGIDAFQELYRKNQWSRELLPNYIMRVSHTKEVKMPLPKKMIEWCFNYLLANGIDNLLMKITASRWQKKKMQEKLNANGNVMGMDANKHYAKPDPQSFQRKFMNVYERSIAATLHKYEHRLKPVH